MNQIVSVQDKPLTATSRKAEWQRKSREKFKSINGYSLKAHYETGGLRKAVLARDMGACVKCGMTDAEHKGKWNRPITIDHKDKNRKNNTMENLQTLCLRCHGNKDLIPRLRSQKVSVFKGEILQMRNEGRTYQYIANTLGFSIAAIWKWCKKWEGDSK